MMTFLLAFIVLTVMPVSAARKKTSGKKKRYLVTCNYHYDNKYNNLASYGSINEAKKKIRKQDPKTRGEWFIYDRLEKKVVWPELSTTRKKISKAIAWTKAVANDSRHGYSCQGESKRSNLQLHWGRWGKKGDYSCSTLVAVAYELSGLADMRTVCKKSGIRMTSQKKHLTGLNSTSIGKAAVKTKHFRDITGRLKKQGKKALKAGDLLVTRSRSHVGMYVGKGWIAEARINEIGWEYAGYPPVRPGDQTGNEIRISPYDKRWHYAYRPY